jgi:hypothetical protein
VSAGSGRRLIRESMLVGLGWCLLAVLRLPAIVLHPTTRLWGHPDTDVASAPWTLWHVAWHLRHHASLGLRSELVGHPEGGVFWPMSPLEAVAVAPITLLLGPVVAYNTLQVLHIGLAAALAYALARYLGGSRLAAAAVTPLLALSPVLLSSAHNGNFEVAQLFWLPAVGLAAHHAARHGGAKRIALAAALLATALVANTYVGFSALAVAGGFGLAAGPGRLRRVAAVLGLGVLMAAPILGVAFGTSLAEGSLFQRASDTILRQRILEGQAAVLGFLKPGVVRAIDTDCLPNSFLNGYAPGFVALALAGVGLVRARGRLAWCMLAMAGVGVLLALGPVLEFIDRPVIHPDARIPAPYALIDWLPPFGSLIELWRFAMITHVAVMVLALLAMLRLPRWAVGLSAALLLGEALLITPGPSVWRTAESPEPQLASLLEGREPGAVMHLPMRQGHWPLYYQTQHSRPIGASMADPLDHSLFGAVVSPTWTLANLQAQASRRQFRWLILHSSEPMQSLQPMESIIAELQSADMIVASQDDLHLVDLQTYGLWPQTQYQPGDRPVPDPDSEAARLPFDPLGRCDGG